MHELLFSYGTLQTDEIQMDLFGRAVDGTRDSLMGYTLMAIEINDAKFLATGAQPIQNIARRSGNPADRIEGTVLKLTPEELSTADAYEPPGYHREKVVLHSGKACWIYLSNQPIL